MNRQRKVVITITYNELGIIIDTKAEELNLSTQPEEHTKEHTKEHTETHACDCISRRDAIDALFKILDRLNHADFLYADEIYKALNELPPAQSYTTEEIIHCKDCIHAGHNLASQVNWCNNRVGFHTVSPYDFCSWAERRQDG